MMSVPLLDTILGVVKGPLDKLIPDKGKKAEFQHAIEMEVLRSGHAQSEVNKQEAGHPSIFVAGWRPFVGWVCGFALLWHFMLFDLATWFQLLLAPETPPLPRLSGTDTLVTVLMSMLGLGGLRTYEKLKGVSREQLKKR